jgi:4-amino-4-deoxy-L-arabinose transferase-like glycosyltransferase
MQKKSDLLNALLCTAVCVIALLCAWPFAEFPFNDDWTWALTVKQLSHTGRLIYNGWSSPSVIAQAYWGLLWVKLFGFSFNVLRLSSWPMVAGAVAFTYLLGRQLGLNARLAFFAGLTLGLSPLFLPMASTFMTDVPGVFFMVLSMHALLCGFERKSIGWLFTGALVALIGGSNRQVVWIVPLVALPYFAWLWRRELRSAAAAAGIWLMVFAGAAGMQHWFGQQPYAIPDPSFGSYVKLAIHAPKEPVMAMFWVGLTLLLMVLPITVAGLRRFSIGKIVLALCIAMGCYLLARHYNKAWLPWMENIIRVSGVLSSNELAGDRPVSLTLPIRRFVSIPVYLAGAYLAATALFWCARSRRLVRRVTDFFFSPTEGKPAAAVVVLVVAAYLVLELTRCISQVAYDRHLLPLIPFVGILILLGQQKAGLQKAPVSSWIALVILAAYGIAATQEVSTLARTRVVAIRLLKDRGIDDPQIDAGFEHSYWTQADRFGHINDARLRNPPGAYNPNEGPTPGLKFTYRLESHLTSYTRPSSFGSLYYFSWLPPFHREVRIDEYDEPTAPPKRQLLPKVLLEQYK